MIRQYVIVCVVGVFVLGSAGCIGGMGLQIQQEEAANGARGCSANLEVESRWGLSLGNRVKELTKYGCMSNPSLTVNAGEGGT